MQEQNILYCGMADDILTPMLLVSNFNQIFAIDYFDDAFSPSGWDGQKQEIVNCLMFGNDRFSHHRQVCLHYRDEVEILEIGHCNIISNEDDGVKWVLQFEWVGKKRTLTYFHHKNFYETWSKEITEINHLMSIGATFDMDNPVMSKMIKERCLIDNCMYYENSSTYGQDVSIKIRDRYVYMQYLNNIKELTF